VLIEKLDDMISRNPQPTETEAMRTS